MKARIKLPLHSFGKDLQSEQGQVGVQGTKEQGQERDIEERERLMRDVGRDHQAHRVSERESNIKDPRDEMLVHNMGRSIQPGIGDQGHAHVRRNTNKSGSNGQALILTSLDHMLETN